MEVYDRKKTAAILKELKKDFTQASLFLEEMNEAEKLSSDISDLGDRYPIQSSIWEARHKVYDALCEFVLKTARAVSQEGIRMIAYRYKNLNTENKSMAERYGIMETEGDGWNKLIVFGEEMAQWAGSQKASVPA